MKTSESDAAFHQIMKTSCLLNELQGKKNEDFPNQIPPPPSHLPSLQNFSPSNLQFLLNVFTNTNIFPDIIKLESIHQTLTGNNNPLKMLSYLADNQKEISATLYNTVMAKKNDNFNLTNLSQESLDKIHSLGSKTNNYALFHHKNTSILNSLILISLILKNKILRHTKIDTIRKSWHSCGDRLLYLRE